MFEHMQQWKKELNASRGDSIKIIICGNKCDLDKREVSAVEGKNFADSIGAAFFETSAKTNTNVEQAFHTAVRKFWESDPNYQKDKKDDVKDKDIPWYKKCILI